MPHVFHRSTRGSLPVAAGGEGCWIVDSSGKRYLDGSGGAAVSCLGHGHPAVIAAMKRQIDTLAYAHTSFFTSDAAEELADVLIAGAPPGIERAYFLSGGSEAMETALKMTRQYFVETGEPERRHFIARRQSYHGNTLGALSVGGHAARRKLYEPLLIATTHIAPCYAYRHRGAQESEEAYGRRVADELEAAIQRLGPKHVAAFVAESISGASLGAVPPAPGYFKRIREICDAHGVLLILDEVMCGMGRSGSLHACEQEGIAPDIMVIAKGLGGGYQPIGAALVSGKIYAAFERGSGAFQHGHTYMGHPVACAAALAVQRVVAEQNLVERVRRQGNVLMAALHERFGNHPNVGDIRGRGLLFGLELVRDRVTKTPFDPAYQLHARVKRLAMERGLLCYPSGGTADGVAGDHVLLAPPFIVTDGEIEEIARRLGLAVDAALAEIAV
ncbi:MAG TPA: aspartate aminotransferase family protein [Candidatus Cybelea sp.]|nr:aspartate aminotransferase family protein [Candidatus Cybelea sp.]